MNVLKKMTVAAFLLTSVNAFAGLGFNFDFRLPGFRTDRTVGVGLHLGRNGLTGQVRRSSTRCWSGNQASSTFNLGRSGVHVNHQRSGYGPYGSYGRTYGGGVFVGL